MLPRTQPSGTGAYVRRYSMRHTQIDPAPTNIATRTGPSSGRNENRQRAGRLKQKYQRLPLPAFREFGHVLRPTYEYNLADEGPLGRAVELRKMEGRMNGTERRICIVRVQRNGAYVMSVCNGVKSGP